MHITDTEDINVVPFNHRDAFYVVIGQAPDLPVIDWEAR